MWASKGIKYLSQICEGGVLLTFDILKTKYTFPNSYLFRYLQLQHASQMQFGNQSVTIDQSKIESLLRADILVKPLSSIYKTLQPSIHDGLDRLPSCWRADVPELDTEDWEDIWDYPMHILVSARDRLIQFNILHRIYLMPRRLHRIYLSHPSQCWRCTADPATFQMCFGSALV